MGNPSAVVNVVFSRPVMGSALVEAVKELCESSEASQLASFVRSQRFDSGEAVFTIGQSSPYPFASLLVAPSKEEHEIRPDEVYGRVQVMSHYWPGVDYFTIGVRQGAVDAAVQGFARRLEQYFAG